MAFFSGQPGQVQRISPLRPEQEQLFSQQQQALLGGEGGAFGQLADFYRERLSGGGTEQFEAPLMRQFNEDILPGIAEQFAGMGAGGLMSGNFIQEQGRAATDLGERLGAMRAGLRQQGAEGLQSLAESGLSPVDELVYKKRQPGVGAKFGEQLLGNVDLSTLLPYLGTAAGTLFGGPAGGAAGGTIGKTLGSFLEK